VCIPVANISQCLRVEDRDTDGIVYATKVLPFNLIRGGKNVGHSFLSFGMTTLLNLSEQKDGKSRALQRAAVHASACI